MFDLVRVGGRRARRLSVTSRAGRNGDGRSPPSGRPAARGTAPALNQVWQERIQSANSIFRINGRLPVSPFSPDSNGSADPLGL